MLNKIKYDIYRLCPEKFSFYSFLKAYRNQGFRYIFFHRIYNSTNNFIIKVLAKLFLRHYCYKFGFQISSKTKIGKGIYFGHFGSVVINENAEIGEFCNINHNVTIGRQNRGIKKGSPKIGNKVWIGVGSVIVGNIKISDNVLIAPNAYVNFDVPENSIVIGNPAKIISKENPTAEYINNIKDL
ncbi:MAG: serine acetyltransferase [Crocinitomicaceae bacterium]|nr:serine acetyltransferase [Crocinitomicaceae bacterium]